MLLPRVELVHVILSCVVLQSHKWCSFLYWVDAPWSLIASVALNYETSLIIPSPAKAKNKKCLVSSILHDGHPKIKIKTALLSANNCSRIRQFEVFDFILSWQLRLRNYVEEDIPDQWNGHRARGSDRLFATLLFCSALSWSTDVLAIGNIPLLCNIILDEKAMILVDRWESLSVASALVCPFFSLLWL